MIKGAPHKRQYIKTSFTIKIVSSLARSTAVAMQ